MRASLDRRRQGGSETDACETVGVSVIFPRPDSKVEIKAQQEAVDVRLEVETVPVVSLVQIAIA